MLITIIILIYLSDITNNWSNSSNPLPQRNVGIGDLTLVNTTTGKDNTAVGDGALSSNTSGNYNVAIGKQALPNNTRVGKIAIGRFALSNNKDGDANVAVGKQALATNKTGNSLTAIENGADVSDTNLTNATALGANAVVSQSNSLVLGNNVKVGIGTSHLLKI